MTSRRTGEGKQVSEEEEEVMGRLAEYDLRRNPQLSALYPPHQYPHTRRCAVLVPLFFSPTSSPRAELHVLLTLRAASLSSHPGQVAFPGGAQEPGDQDDTHTALREAHEEVGLPPDDVRVVAHLPPVFIRNNNSVFPVVGFIPHDFQPRPNAKEVERVFSVPLKSFVEKDKVTLVPITVFGRSFQLPHVTHVTDGTKFVVWGATCLVCVALAQAIFGSAGGMAGESAGDEHSDGCKGQGGEDENMFAMLKAYYHATCAASRPSSRM